jgi:hypothetical protein
MATYNLAHPLYLDVQMMVSFLAYLEGGVTFEGEEKITSSDSRSRSGKLSGKAKFPSLATWFGAEFSGEGAIDRKLDQSSEYKSERHHTAASLFNYLYAYLVDDEQISTVSTAEDLADLNSGQLIQISGRYLGNALSEVLNYFDRLLPYLEKQEEDKEIDRTKAKSAKRSGNPAVRATAPEPTTGASTSGEEEEISIEDLIRLIKMMHADLNSSAIHDLLLTTPAKLKVILTVSSQYYSPETAEHLRAGDFVVLGKVTRILRETETINLARRTAVSVLDEDATRTAVVAAAGALSISEETATNRNLSLHSLRLTCLA